jgi:hypothetical protein
LVEIVRQKKDLRCRLNPWPSPQRALQFLPPWIPRRSQRSQ